MINWLLKFRINVDIWKSQVNVNHFTHLRESLYFEWVVLKKSVVYKLMYLKMYL